MLLETKGQQILPPPGTFLKGSTCENKKPVVPWQANVHSWKDKEWWKSYSSISSKDLSRGRFIESYSI